MKDFDAATTAALAAAGIVPRDFLWLVPRDRETGEPRPVGFWSDLGALSAPVLDPDTGAAVLRTYRGAGDLIEVGAVPLVTGLSVQTVTIRLSQIAADAQQVLRGYDLRRAEVQLHRGFLDPASGVLVAPAVPFFTGEIDAAPVETPPEGEDGGITLTAVSAAQELTRSNPAKRSDADQRERAPGDGFLRHAATVGSWRISWGQKGG